MTLDESLDGTTSEWSLRLPWLPEGWNEYIHTERGNRYAAAKVKKAEKDAIAALCRFKAPYSAGYPCKIVFAAYFSSKRKDLDNLRLKGIIDGLVAAGMIENDNLSKIQEIVLTANFNKEESLQITIAPLPGKHENGSSNQICPTIN